MKIDENKVAEILTFEEESSSGECCKFIDLENGWGIKCFDYDVYCDVSYVCQKEAAKHNLAPKVGKRFELIDHNGDGWFCHLTETAECIAGYGYCNSQTEYFEQYEGEDAADYLRDERDDMLNQFRDVTGEDYRDDHIGNWGWIYRKEKPILVPIDFNLCLSWYQKLTGIEV